MAKRPSGRGRAQDNIQLRRRRAARAVVVLFAPDPGPVIRRASEFLALPMEVRNGFDVIGEETYSAGKMPPVMHCADIGPCPTWDGPWG